MSGIIFEAIRRKYRSNKRFDNFDIDKRSGIAAVVVKLLAESIENEDNAMLAMLCGSLASEVTFYLNARLTLNANLAAIRKDILDCISDCFKCNRVTPPRNIDINDKRFSQTISVEQYDILRDSCTLFDDIPRLLAHRRNQPKPNNAVLHERLFTRYSSKDEHHQLLLCCGLRPDDNMPGFSKRDINPALLENEFIKILHVSVLEGINKHSYNEHNTLKTKSPHHLAMQLLGVKQLAYLDTNISDIKLSALLNATGVAPETAKLLPSDFSLCQSLIVGEKSIKKLTDLHASLTEPFRYSLEQTNDGIKFGKWSITTNSETIFHRMQEKVLLTRAAANRLDYLCEWLTRDFSKINPSVMKSLCKSIEDFFTRDPEVEYCVVDLELKGLAGLISKLNATNNNHFTGFTGENKTLFLNALPLNTLTHIASEPGLSQSVLQNLMHASVHKLMSGLFLHEIQVTIPTLTRFLTTAEKANPGVFKLLDVKSKAQEYFHQKDERFSNGQAILLGLFTQSFNENFYDCPASESSVTERADMSFVEHHKFI